MQNNVLTASRIASFQTCPRRHYWQYEIGLASDSQSSALFIGSAWHRAMEALWKGASFEDAFAAAWPDGTDADALTANKIAGLLKAYYVYWGDCNSHGFTFTMPETQFKDTTHKKLKPFSIEGKIDLLAQRESKVFKLEHKTTSESVQPDSGYWMRLRFNTQILQYFLAARSLGIEVDYVIYDVVRKPSIEPKMIDDLDENQKKIVTDANGERVYNQAGKNKGEPRQTADKERGYVLKQHLETPEEFGERLYNDVLSRPDFYFARREVPILEDDLKNFEAQRLTIAKTILHHRKLESKFEQKEFAWPRNVSEQTCKFCSYQSFCLQNLSIDPANPPSGFAIKPFNPELNYDTTQENSIAATY